MRNWWALVLVAVCSCGGADEELDDGGVFFDLGVTLDLTARPDLAAPPDGTVPPDFSGINCGAQTCSAGELCCGTPSGGAVTYACSASCADGGLTIACDGPDNCRSGSATLCCGTLFTSGGTAPFCNFTPIAACADSCTTQLPPSCNADPGMVRLCHRAADCASDTKNPNCCRFSSGGQDLTFCASDTIKSVATTCFN